MQGDLAFVEILAQMGAVVEQDEQSTTLIAGSGLQGVDVDMHHISDTVMTLAAIAPLAQGPTTIRNIANIRIKECDRLQALVENLRQLGQRVDHGEDWLQIHPASIRPATIACHRDHRIAMSFAILGCYDLLGNGKSWLQIKDPACCGKTFPHFFEVLESLRT